MISQNIQSLRKRKGFSQEVLAEKLNVSRQTVTKWETGESQPDASNCIALAKLFGISIDDLLTYNQSDAFNLPLPPKGKHIFGTAKINERGQIVIPKSARELFNLQIGDELIVLGDEGQGLALVKSDWLINMLNSTPKNGK